MADCVADRIREEFTQIAAHLHRDMERERMLEGEFENAIRAKQFRLEEDKRLGYFCGVNLDAQQWERLQADYRAWSKSRPCESAVGREWLTVTSSSEARPIAEIKKEFFDVREALCLGIEEFEAAPESIEQSAIGDPVFAGKQSMLFPCKELERLFNHLEEAAPGVKRVFALESGVEMRATIESVAEEEKFFKIKASGYITEYMRPEDRSLEIFGVKGKFESPVVEFYFTEEDCAFFRDNPRFKPYFDFLAARELKSRSASMKRVRAMLDSRAAD